MKNWSVAVMQRNGKWLNWGINGYWSRIHPAKMMEKTDAENMAKRVFGSVHWVYGVKITDHKATSNK